MSADPQFLPLLDLLLRRREIIADHPWRDRDSAEHLAALQEVSEAISREHARLGTAPPPRLQHYLTQCSYDKAAGWIQSGGRETAS